MKEKLRAAEAALRHAAEHGVTSVHEMADASSFEVYQELARQGRLTARLYVYIPIDDVDIYARLKLKTPFGNDYLKIGGLKGFVDGSLGSATAYFFEPYTDDPSTSGLLAQQMFPEGIMEKRILEADRAGLQVAIHAIGDRAISMLLDIFEKAVAANGPRDRRWRVEHAQHIRPADIARFGRLGLIASVQPYHAYDDGRWAERKIGKVRARTTYAFKSLREAGAVLAFGSDWTVAPLDPISGIFAAVTRETSDGKNPGGWVPEEKISVEEAVRGYTTGGGLRRVRREGQGEHRGREAGRPDGPGQGPLRASARPHPRCPGRHDRRRREGRVRSPEMRRGARWTRSSADSPRARRSSSPSSTPSRPSTATCPGTRWPRSPGS